MLSVLVFSLFAGLGHPAKAQTLTGPASLQSNRVADNANPNVRAQVAGHIPTWATPAADAGTVANDAPQLLTFGVARSPEVQAAFEQLIVDQQNPLSPRYHQWLTPEQIGEQFGPTQHDLDALTTWLTAQGFVVSNVTPSRVFVQATAPSAVVGNALQISLHTYNVNGNKLQAPLTEPTFPAALAPMVKFVSGLTTVQYRNFSTVMPKLPLSALGLATPGATTPAAITPAVHTDYTLGGGTAHYLAPADFNLIYNVTPTLNAGITGAGYRVAIIGGSRLLPSDVTSWETISGLPSYQPNYIVPPGLGDPGITSNGNQGEATLDFERVYGTAPGVGVDFVISSLSLSKDTDTLELYAINTLQDPILSMSYGACETGFPTHTQQENAIFQQAIAQGISIFASSGDTGIAGCEPQGVPPATQYASVEVPCASAFVTCVGGTQFSDTTNPSSYWSPTNGPGKLSALSYIPEGGWNEPTSTDKNGNTNTNVDASVGGPSLYIAKPSWQTGSTIPADGARDVPDISFSASGHNAYFSCLAYAGADCTTYVTGFGGTSASAPSMAGLAALIDQKLGKRQGLLNPILYATATKTPAAFHDPTPATSGVASCSTAVPSTCNNSTPSPTAQTGGLAGYPLLVGYDFPTGLGSLDFSKFLTAISLPSPTITVTAAPSTITVSQTATFTATLSSPAGTPTGTVQFLANNAQLFSNNSSFSVAIPIAGNTATTAPQGFAPAATYTITAVYSGDANFSPTTSNGLAFVVTNPNAVPSTSSLTVTPAPATTLQPVTIIATVKGSGTTPTGIVQFYDSGIATGVPIPLTTGGTATYNPGTLTATTHNFTCLYTGDGSYSASFCPSVADVVSTVPSNTVETLSASTITAVGTTVLSYVVSSSSGGVPTGTITAYAIQTSPVSAPAATIGSISLTNGAAGGNLTGVFPGTYTLYGVYSGDGAYAPSTSQKLTLSVSGFTASASPGTLVFGAGSTSANTVTVTYLSVNGFSGTISQSCTLTPVGVVAVPIGPTCSFSPTSVTLAGASGSSVVSIGSSASAVSGGVQVGSLQTAVLGGVSFAGLLVLLLPSRRRILRNWRGLAVILFLGATLFTAVGCGSGGTNGPGSVITGTTRGGYTLTVTASANGQTATTTTAITIQ